MIAITAYHFPADGSRIAGAPASERVHAAPPLSHSGGAGGAFAAEERRDPISEAWFARRGAFARILVEREAAGLEKLLQKEIVRVGIDIVAQKIGPPFVPRNAAESVEKGSTPGRDGGMS